MRIYTLVENTAKENYYSEHGLSLYIEYGDKKILLDAGKSDYFMKNAEVLGVGLENVDIAVLSHAHYDHSDGLAFFLEKNGKTRLYISENAKENCYGGDDMHYIGLQSGFLAKYRSRMQLVGGNYEIADGIYLIPHNTKGLEKIGKENKLYRMEQEQMIPDDFNHEQSLVLRTDKGLVIFNSCSHGRVDTILEEVKAALPGEEIYAFIGGFHLSKCTDEYVRAYAKNIKKYRLQKIFTGHCTGEVAFAILQEEFGNTVDSLWSGKTIEL